MKLFLHVVAVMVFTFVSLGVLGMLLRIMYEGFMLGWKML